MPKQISEEIKEEIQSLDLSIRQYWQILNQEGLWLFLATLGVWSVSYDTLQNIAALIILIVFTSRVFSRSKENGFFSSQIKSITSAIESKIENDSDAQKARKFELELVKSKLSAAKSIPNIILYLLCAGFYGLSVGHWTETINF